MKSKVLIGTARNDKVRVYLADTKELVQVAQTTHNLYPTSAAALGRTLSITAIMGIMLKGERETVTTTINGHGAIGTIMVVAKSNGQVKGFCGDNELYLKYNDSNKLAVGLIVGKDGYLQVTKDLQMKSKYTSQVELQTGEIGDDFAYYFMASEQRPTITSVGVLVGTDFSIKSAGCLLIELLPDALEEDIVYLENLSKTLEPISSVLENRNDIDNYLKELFPDYKLLETRDLEYVCDCSKQRFIDGIMTLPEKDKEDLFSKGEFEVKCEFCNKIYKFNKDDLASFR